MGSHERMEEIPVFQPQLAFVVGWLKIPAVGLRSGHPAFILL